MRLFHLPFLLPLCSLAVVVACSGASDGAPGGGEESNFTSALSEGGVDASADGTATSSAAADIAPFTIAEVAAKPKLRFSVNGAQAVDAYEPEWTTLISGSDRRFRLQGASPAPDGKPGFYVEFGRGAALIEKGTYDCTRMEAVAVIVDTDGAKKFTLVNGAPQRACTVVIDEAVDHKQTTGVRPRSWRDVIGHVEAIVGDRTNAASDTKTVRAAFAVSVIEVKTF